MKQKKNNQYINSEKRLKFNVIVKLNLAILLGNLQQDQRTQFQWLPHKDKTSGQSLHCWGWGSGAGKVQITSAKQLNFEDVSNSVY